MDPNANLMDQVAIIKRAIEEQDEGGALDMDDFERLVELQEALIVWLAGGGFAPDWKAAIEEMDRKEDDESS